VPIMNRFKKIPIITIISVACIFMPVRQAEAAIPILEIIRQAVKKVIVAIDLKVQRLQNETIWLQNAQKVLENKLSELKLKEIAGWTEKHRKLYEQYYNELWQIKNAISSWQHIRQIMKLQERLVDEYLDAWKLLKRDERFTRSELDHMYRVYSGILEESVRNLDEILLVINPFKTQMSDSKRLEIIGRAGNQIEQNYADLKAFNAQNVLLSLNRAKDNHEVETIRKLYGIE
jgi:hypothetical protein